MCCVRTRGMVQNLMDQAQEVPPAADEGGDPDYVPLETQDSEESAGEESDEVSDGASETPGDDKDPDYIPLEEDVESFDEVAVQSCHTSDLPLDRAARSHMCAGRRRTTR